MNSLPAPSPEEIDASAALRACIAAEIRAGNGWLPFVRYQELCLYAPGLGYYSGGSCQFGATGDFVTAPELTPLFGQCLARQAEEIMAHSAPHIFEAGAGSGRLAADVLAALAACGSLPESYTILELSPSLRARQKETLAQMVPQLLPRVSWCVSLPETFSGCVLGNELLDALPVHAYSVTEAGVFERGVALDAAGEFMAAERPASPALGAAVAALPIPEHPWQGEVGLIARAWVAAWGKRLQRGALLLIDYGASQQELLHPQRNGGTLRCYYRQRLHTDFFWQPGLSDITSHVDFTALAEAAYAAGCAVLGYTAQAHFLVNCGLGEWLAAKAITPQRQGAVRLLTAPGEMGEVFKVLAVGKHMPAPLLGFRQGDRRHAL